MTEASLVTVTSPAVPMHPEPTGPQKTLRMRVRDWPCTRARVEGLTFGLIFGFGVAAQIIVNVPR